MDNKDKTKLANIAQRLQELCTELTELVKELENIESTSAQAESGKRPPDDFNLLATELKSDGREVSLQKLRGWKQTDLARLYKHLGGTSRDSKKPKKWLLERILWQLFDFQSGHQLLKDET